MTNFREQQEKWEEQNLFHLAKKSSKARRWKEELQDQYRTEYQRDIGRILYSDAFRRLRMKTQVFPASGSDQHNRTRLTHSLEVAQIAKSIARPLKLNLDLSEAIALGHDLGHTPFGHAGEDALKKCLKDKSTFNHNVQSVWILRSTLSNRRDINYSLIPGYNLTHDVVEGVWKHTDYEETVNEIDSLKYYNPKEPSSLEGQTVDKADGIAYLKHDIDDGIRNRLLDLREFEEICNNNCDIKFDYYTWNNNLIHDVIIHSKEKDKIDFSPDMKKLYKEIKNLVFEKIIKSDFVKQKDHEGIEKITTIYNYIIKNPEYLTKKFPSRNQYTIEKYGLERAVIDYIQWLGDENASTVYESIINGKTPNGISADAFYEEKDIYI